MKKQQQKFLFIFALMCISFTVSYAQESIVSSGDNETGLGGSSSYSVAQILYNVNSGSNGFVTQGVQQPYEIIALGTDDFAEINLVMSAYPNPTIDAVHLVFSDDKWTDLSYQLFDSSGRTLSKLQKITASETLLPMQEKQVGIYFVSVSNADKTVKTFKIIKK